jgi:hypothetical protein
LEEAPTCCNVKSPNPKAVETLREETPTRKKRTKIPTRRRTREAT